MSLLRLAKKATLDFCSRCFSARAFDNEIKFIDHAMLPSVVSFSPVQ